MKNSSITMSLVVAIVVSTFSTVVSQETTITPQEKKPAVWRKITTFAQKHKGKIIAGGLAIVAAILGTVTVAYINEKAEDAIRQAGIDVTKKYHQDYKDAYYLITHYGLLGADRGIESLIKNKDASALTYISTSKAGNALAIFWGMDQFTLATRLGFKGVGAAVRRGVEGAKETARNTKEAVKGFVNRYF